MSKEMILMADVKDLGKEGEVVVVADGFARNYLLPKKLAAPVTAATRRQLEKKQRGRMEEEANAMEVAEKMAAKLAEASCTLPVKAGPEGKLFGSISAGDIIAALKEMGFELDRHQLELNDPLREVGVYNVSVRLHPKVEATIKVWVVEE